MREEECFSRFPEAQRAFRRAARYHFRLAILQSKAKKQPGNLSVYYDRKATGSTRDQGSCYSISEFEHVDYGARSKRGRQTLAFGLLDTNRKGLESEVNRKGANSIRPRSTDEQPNKAQLKHFFRASQPKVADEDPSLDYVHRDPLLFASCYDKVVQPL